MEDRHTTDEQLIEDYLAGELHDEQLKQVEQRLEQDAGFRQLVRQEEELVEGIRTASRKELHLKLQALEERLPEVHHPSKVVALRRPAVYWIAAASIGLILALFVLWPSHKADPYALYTAYYEPYPNFSPVAVRGEGQPELSLKEQGMLAYDERNYTVAIEKLSAAYAESQAPETGFYLAQSYLGMSQTQKALPLFEQLSARQSDLQEMINWYRSLSWLYEGEVEKARQGLQKISSEKSFKFKEAEELLKQLE